MNSLRLPRSTLLAGGLALGLLEAIEATHTRRRAQFKENWIAGHAAAGGFDLTARRKDASLE